MESKSLDDDDETTTNQEDGGTYWNFSSSNNTDKNSIARRSSSGGSSIWIEITFDRVKTFTKLHVPISFALASDYWRISAIGFVAEFLG